MGDEKIMRLTGTTAMGIRLPIINPGDDLVSIVADHVLKVTAAAPLTNTDVIAVTEAIVAKYENNFASIHDIGTDVRAKFGGGEVGLVYPMLSRNRFFNILKGIATGAEKLHVLLSYPHDEVGNPIMDINRLDEIVDALPKRMVSADEFSAAAGEFLHPFTGIDYLKLYKEAGENISIHLSNDPRDILKITPNVLVGEIHNRFITKSRLLKAGAKTVHTLSDILSKSVNGSGYNAQYGVLGSNLSGEGMLKLFPSRAPEFVAKLQGLIKEKTGVTPEIMVYGDGAFKDPVCGIWELADPVVSPGYTKRLEGKPDEVKFKMIADTVDTGLSREEKHEAVANMIKNKAQKPDAFREGTTPRVYADLLGSLCDLIGGSGDKGTPVVLVRGYFDDYTVG
ncbi:MAG: coenzyme F420-0:L-glutamate ligase [Defluviitaleaceae bacterium]|nr:coenzyme F420-0:L-glutamate ligase [Defluviitaleaceae bacterium]